MTMAIKQIVMYDEKVGKAPLQKAVKAYKCEVIYDYNIINGMALKKLEDKSLEETMQHFRGVKELWRWNMTTSQGSPTP